MRGNRLLFVLASLVALGLVGFANFPSDRDAVADSQAAQMVGGGCSWYGTFNCTTPCSGGCICGTGNTNWSGTASWICGFGTNTNCGQIVNGCGG